MVYLEKQYLSNGERGLDLVKNELKLLLLQGMAGDEWEEDRWKWEWENWIKRQVDEAIFNATVPYNQIYGEGSGNSGGKSKLLEKLEN